MIFSRATSRPIVLDSGAAIAFAFSAIAADESLSTTLIKAVLSSSAWTLGAAVREPQTPIWRYSTLVAKSYVSIQTGRTI